MKPLFEDIQDDLQAAALEFIGTVVWLVLSLGGIQAAAFSAMRQSSVPPQIVHGHIVGTVPSISQLLFNSLSMGMGLLSAVWLFYRRVA